MVVLDEDEVDNEEVEDLDDVHIPESFKDVFKELWDGPKEGPERDEHIAKVLTKSLDKGLLAREEEA